eukprot:1156183-Pelagomonas_calceolata.AAC.7
MEAQHITASRSAPTAQSTAETNPWKQACCLVQISKALGKLTCSEEPSGWTGSVLELYDMVKTWTMQKTWSRNGQWLVLKLQGNLNTRKVSR